MSKDPDQRNLEAFVQANEAAMVSMAETEANFHKDVKPANLLKAAVSAKPAAPPKTAEYLLYLLLSREDREAMPGDLEEEYWTVILPKFGSRRAKFWYCCQVARSVGPILIGALDQTVDWVIKKLQFFQS